VAQGLGLELKLQYNKQNKAKQKNKKQFIYKDRQHGLEVWLKRQNTCLISAKF
jgi:hypothetical protein